MFSAKSEASIIMDSGIQLRQTPVRIKTSFLEKVGLKGQIRFKEGAKTACEVRPASAMHLCGVRGTWFSGEEERREQSLAEAISDSIRV